jgi:hypothetical protein
VLLSPSRETRGGAASAYAAVAGKGPVALVDAKVVGELSRSVDELRDRRLMNVEVRDIKRVRLQAGGQTAVLERKSDTEWRMLEPTKGSAAGGKVDDLLYTLRALRWKEIVAPDAAKDPARFGLDAPTMEVALFRGDGGELLTVQVGKRDGDVAYLRLKGQPTVYGVEGRVLGPTPKVPDDFKG